MARAFHTALLLVITLLACLLAGCVTSPLPANPPTGDARPYLVHLPGVGGDTVFDRWWLRGLEDGLKDGGVDADVEVFDWTGHCEWIHVLQSYRHNRDLARQLAGRIAFRARAEPTQPVYLTADSGGAGVAVWALEQLPDDVRVRTVVLVAPAVSPGYDLTRALRHVSGHLYAVTSPCDVLTLGLGTTLFGTTDAVHGSAAGRVGFHMPPAADPAQYRKLVPMPWRPGWIIHGHFGGHTGGMSAGFARHVLAPVLRHDLPAGEGG